MWPGLVDGLDVDAAEASGRRDRDVDLRVLVPAGQSVVGPLSAIGVAPLTIVAGLASTGTKFPSP
jgi:hypothetical protein